MTLFQILGIGWMAVTGAVIALMMHRAILGFREDDQLYLAPAETGLLRKQVEISARLDQLTRTIHRLTAASIVVLAFMLAVGARQVLLALR